MAEMLSKSDFDAIKRDIEDAGKTVNTDAVIDPRYGDQYKSFPMLSRLFEAMLDQGLLDLDELNQVIQIAAAAGAGANGWTASLVIDGDKTQKQINDDQKISNESQAHKNSLNVDILDFIPPSEWPAIFSKTSNYDCGPALALAIATGKQVVINTRGLYKIKTAYSGTTDFDLKMTDGVVLDLSECSGSYAISNSGSVTKLTKTWGALTAGFHKVTFNDVSGLNIGDWLCFYNPISNSYADFPNRSNYNDGEWKQIKRIVGNTVSFGEPFLKTYVADLDLYKLNSVICKIQGGELINESSTLVGSIQFSLSSDAQVHTLSANAKQNSVILFDRCVEPKSSNINGTNEGAGTDDYFVVHSNCWNGYHSDGKFYSRRHAFAMGGGAGPCNVPNTRSIVENTVLECDPEALTGAADMHGNVRLSEYRNCEISGGSNIGGGEWNYYRGCKITSDAGGCVGFAREILGGDFGWIDCEVTLTADPQTARGGSGVFDFGGNGSPITSATTKDLNINLKGIKVKDTGVVLGSATTFSKVRNRGTTKKVNINFDGITFNTTSKFYYGLQFDCIAGTGATANSDFIIFDNVRGNLPSSYLVRCASNADNETYENKPMRMPISTGVTTLTTTAVQSLLGDVVTMPFTYPRKPIPLGLVARGVAGATKTTFGGQYNPLFSIGTQAATNTFRAQMASSVAFTAGDTVEVCYQMGIREC